jgi:formaldehyde-activating enzyme involved in methanogenesis
MHEIKNDTKVYTNNYNSNKLNITAEILCNNKKEKNSEKDDSTGGSNAN